MLGRVTHVHTSTAQNSTERRSAPCPPRNDTPKTRPKPERVAATALTSVWSETHTKHNGPPRSSTLLRAVAVMATASIQVHRLSRRHMQAASGSLLTAGEWLGIVLPPTRHSLTPLCATIAHDTLAAPLTNSPPDIVGRYTTLSRGSRQTGPHDGACSGHQIPVPIVACARSQPLESTA
jgi:hypothetical protein